MTRQVNDEKMLREFCWLVLFWVALAFFCGLTWPWGHFNANGKANQDQKASEAAAQR